MNRRELLLMMGAASVLGEAPGAATAGTGGVAGAEGEALPADAWARKAQALIPALAETVQRPLALVRAVADPALALRFRMEHEADAAALASRVLKSGEAVVLDFGGHRTGYLSLTLDTDGRPADAPARLRFTFGEVPTDVAEPLHPYKGQLASSWLPEEVMTFDLVPGVQRLPRRYAFRYVKIEMIDAAPGYGLRISEVLAHAVTSAGAMPAAVGADAAMRRIDEVAMATLRDCMQTTFEDGPRRDRRLWVGDLRLQALANYATFKQYDLVRRCLYLFAAFTRADGFVAACVYERPVARYGNLHIIDYAALFNVALLDYAQASGDVETARELWPVALRQLEIIGADIDAQGLYRAPKGAWVFIDWQDGLERSAAIQGLLIFAWKQTLRLAQLIGREGEVAGYAQQIARMTAAAREAFWDARRGMVVSGGQVSWASAAWMTLGGVLTRAESAAALRGAMAAADAVKLVTPYLYHYVAEALLDAGLKSEARRLVREYWGAMAAAGADTFWEVFDPAAPLSSPYGDIHINSYCHAWSCTPAYLFRRGLG